MKRFIFSFTILLMILSMSGSANAVLTDFGDSGQYFYDSITGLYWYDPVEFLGQSRLQVDSFLTSNPNWEYGILSDLTNLLNNYDESTNPQPDNMWIYIGDPTRTVIDTAITIGTQYYPSVTSYYWEGYLALNNDTSIDGEFGFLETNTLVNTKGFFTSSDIFPAPEYFIGAWLKSSIDPTSGSTPVPEPSTLLLLGTGLIGLAGFRRKFRS